MRNSVGAPGLPHSMCRLQDIPRLERRNGSVAVLEQTEIIGGLIPSAPVIEAMVSSSTMSDHAHLAERHYRPP